MRIYVASSWRNAHQPEIVQFLRDQRHEVYDFRNPPNRTGFAWSQIDERWEKWSPSTYRVALNHYIAIEGYLSDRSGMDNAEACVLVLPCGRSAHLEAGFMAGQGKPVVVYMPEPCEPELMYLLLGTFGNVVLDQWELNRMLKGIERGWVPA